MRNLLEYLNLCLEFIDETTTEAVINSFMVNVRSAMKDMSVEQMEGFELAFEALDLFYQRQTYAIDTFHTSLRESSIGSDIETSFDQKLAQLDDYARKLQCTVLFMGRVSDAIAERKSELLGTSSEEKSLC